MKPSIRLLASSLALGSFLFCASAWPQQATPNGPQAYDPSHETTIQGTVVSFTPASATPPLGAVVTVQTSSGAVQVHLGSARFLATHQFTLSAGDTVQITGENLQYGQSSDFFARVIQKGSQILVIRSGNGFPLKTRGTKLTKQQGGAL